MKNIFAHSILCCVLFMMLSCVSARNSKAVYSNIKLPNTNKELHIDLKNFDINEDNLSYGGNKRLISAENRDNDLMVIIVITKATPPFKMDEQGFGDPLESEIFYSQINAVPSLFDDDIKKYSKANYSFKEYDTKFKASHELAFHSIDTYIAVSNYLILVKTNKLLYKPNEKNLLKRIVESISIVDAQPAKQNEQQ